MSNKPFQCPDCKKRCSRLSMRHTDGAYVCESCVPAEEYEELALNRKEAERV